MNCLSSQSLEFFKASTFHLKQSLSSSCATPSKDMMLWIICKELCWLDSSKMSTVAHLDASSKVKSPHNLGKEHLALSCLSHEQ